MASTLPYIRTLRLVLPLVALTASIVAACAGSTGSTASSSVPALGSSPSPSAGAFPSSSGATGSVGPVTPAPSTDVPSQAPDTGGLTTAGDIPDNAVFLTYHDQAHGFAIGYVEGWQVTTGHDGVVVRDKDSSETVTVVPPPSDVAAYITNTDLPSLQSQPGFALVKRDRVKIGPTRTYDHLVVHLPAPADPVTGKQVPSTVDRYYVPGPKGLAIVSLSTPDGVDNVDAFRQMIESFVWS